MRINLPDGTVLNAPDDADPSVVAKGYLRKQRIASYKTSNPAEYDPQSPVYQNRYGDSAEASKWIDAGKNVGSAVVRPVAQAIAAPGNMVADFGQALTYFGQKGANALRSKSLSDLIVDRGPTQPRYQSQSFNEALDTYTRAPEKTSGRVAEAITSGIFGGKIPLPSKMPGSSAPVNFRNSQNELRQGILKAGSKEGLVVPPSAVNPTIGNRILEGIAGKLKLGQEAATRNQPQIDRLMARSVGENSGAQLIPDSLRAIRGEAAATGYAPIREAGTIATDAKYLSELDAITKASQGASRSFPGMVKQSPIDDVIASMKQDKFNAGDGIDALSYLREQADTAYSSGDAALGKAYKAASKAIEDAIERDLSGRGKSGETMLTNFRKARELMAKTFTAGKSMVGDTGNFSAQKVAGELSRGKPLTGDQRLVGQFGGAFPRYSPAPKGDAFPSVSPLDVYGSGIASAAADSALPFAYPLTRMGLRSYLLSSAGQARAIPKPQQAPSFMGVAGAFPAIAHLRGLFGE